MFPIEGLVNQGHHLSPSPTENNNIDGYTVGMVPTAELRRALADRHCESGIGMGSRLTAFRRPVPSLPIDGMSRSRNAHLLPPHVPVVGEGAVGIDGLGLQHLHGDGIGAR